MKKFANFITNKTKKAAQKNNSTSMHGKLPNHTGWLLRFFYLQILHEHSFFSAFQLRAQWLVLELIFNEFMKIDCSMFCWRKDSTRWDLRKLDGGALVKRKYVTSDFNSNITFYDIPRGDYTLTWVAETNNDTNGWYYVISPGASIFR